MTVTYGSNGEDGFSRHDPANVTLNYSITQIFGVFLLYFSGNPKTM